MEIDRDGIDDAVQALLWLTRCDAAGAWKTHDCGTMDRLDANGMINKPKSRNTSVWFTEQGLAERGRLFKQVFITQEE
jgi:hypothetical protein